ncbi:ChaN family lipoprotein [Pleurocapsa sp. FMAR1]|uniref:ChaN family lipoprotein n=1 Tax=Pleurocapsa sp. FMAR1 TaxID=3040204 RepID=UPI0029C80F87|nr:ChaN family lipoprotein [Pleurocapsa sp. FMAR1]
MKLKIPALICFFSAFLAGFIFQYPNQATNVTAKAVGIISEQKINQLKQYDVIYLGENHDRAEHHAAELEIITQLDQAQANSKTRLAIGLEMFQRPFQPILDLYLSGEISEAELREQTEYDTRWGFDWEFYAPILRFAQENKIPLIALNTPAEVTQKVAETGLDSLKDGNFRYILPLAEIKLDNQEYRQKMAEVYQAHAQNGQGNSSDQENFYAAQVLWDETMADAIARYYNNHPQSQIVVLVGKAHVMDNYAIPERVNRRIKDKSFSQTSFLLEE